MSSNELGLKDQFNILMENRMGLNSYLKQKVIQKSFYLLEKTLMRIRLHPHTESFV